MDDPVLVVASLTKPDVASAAITNFCRLNPRFDGAELADIIDVLILHDSYVREWEDWADSYGRHPSIPLVFMRAAWLVIRLAFQDPDVDRDAVYALAFRAHRKALNRSKP